MSSKDLNKGVISVTSQCTKTGENGEIVTVSITTEESHQATVLGKLMNAKACHDKTIEQVFEITTSINAHKPYYEVFDTFLRMLIIKSRVSI